MNPWDRGINGRGICAALYFNTNNQTYFESKAYTKVMDFVIVFSYQNILRFKKNV